jgi:DNA-binding NarL/FixJ family response regulator
MRTATVLKEAPVRRRSPQIVVLSDRAVLRDCVVHYLRHNGFSGTKGCPKWTALEGRLDAQGPVLLLLDAGQEHEDPAEELRKIRARWPATTAVAIGTPIQLAAQTADADGWIDVAEPGARLSMIAHAATSAKHARLLGLHPPAAVERQIATWRVLTPRQRQVLALLGFGLENGDVAGTLGISERTVKLHVSALLDKFGAANRVQLALIAGKAGLKRDAPA